MDWHKSIEYNFIVHQSGKLHLARQEQATYRTKTPFKQKKTFV